MITFADIFAGGGGVTTGAFAVPGIHVSWALNHDEKALKLHKANHPETKHYEVDIRKQNVNELNPVDVLWASLECTEHSKAKGGKDKNIGSFTLGWELIRYIVYSDPKILLVENVPEFRKWGKLENGKRVKGKEGFEYVKWRDAIMELGYDYRYRILNTADYGIPTRRERYIGIFAKKGINITWPKKTHHEKKVPGKEKWVPCKDYLDLNNEGISIFGRALNPLVKKHKRPLVDNTLRRIAGGIKKYYPELYFIMSYYGNGNNCKSINKPLNTITVKDRHALIKIEKIKFIQDHCHTDQYNELKNPLKTIMTRQTKEIVTVEKRQFITKYHNDVRKNGSVQIHATSLKNPLSTITTVGRNALVTAKRSFISSTYNSNGKPESNNKDINDPLASITTQEKHQFVTAYFNSSDNPETQNQSLNVPLNTIMTGTNKKALITAIQAGEIDFDIKMRFLTIEEQSRITGFPDDYFDKYPLTVKEKQKMIGNAVPVYLATLLVEQAKNMING